MNHALQGDLAPVTVVCLCAEWCGVCRDYVQAFRQVQERIPHARMIWIDVEDEADLLHPLEVENFPTVLIAVDGRPRFFGPLRPQLETLERLIRAQMTAADPSPLSDRSVSDLADRILAAKART